jgi:hypothetical protein
MTRLTWQDVPRILKEESTGMIAKGAAVERLKLKGIAQATTYKWLDKAIGAGLLKVKEGYLVL